MKIFKKINWKRMLLDNWVLKLASLTVAFLLWFVVVTVDDPIQDKTFYNIKVNVLNTKKFTDAGMVVEVLDGTDVVRNVSFEAPRSVLNAITTSDIVAVADMNNLTLNNTVEIELSCPKYPAEVMNLEGNVEFVKLNIEEKISKWIDIEEKTIGEVAEGYLIGNVTLDRNRMEIEGPASKINQVKKAVVDVNVAEINSDISAAVDVYLLDAEGETMISDAIKRNVTSVTAKVDVLKIKEIPVEYVPVGEVAEGYLTTGVMDAGPATVLIAGNSPAIDEFSKITVSEELDLTDVTETLIKEINLKDYLPAGMVFADSAFNGKANVTVYVEDEVKKEVYVRRNNLQIVSAPEDMMVQVVVGQEMPRLTVSGLKEDVDPLSEATLFGKVDVEKWINQNQLEEITPGTYSLPIEFQLMEGQYTEDTLYIQVQFSAITEQQTETE